MTDEKLSLTMHHGKLSIHSRSGKGPSLYLINITADGKVEACGGVSSRHTNFLCEGGEDKVLLR